MKDKKCRFCKTELKHTFIDLGMSPLSNAYVKPEKLNSPESFYPLYAYVCDKCFLVQLEEYETPQNIFGDYAYFSSYSDLWLEHVRKYTDKMIERFKIGKRSQVVEIASNDGYLLQFFHKYDIPVLGIEPAANVALAARAKGIATEVDFFGSILAERLKREGKGADLLIGNNVLAHVPDLDDFVSGMKMLLNTTGIITLEFPHLLKLMAENQFDTIYHEHFSYFSLNTVERIFTSFKLKIFDVDELDTHGGSLRIYVCHADNRGHDVSPRVRDLLAREKEYGLLDMCTYQTFAEKVKESKRSLLDFLIEVKRQGKSVVGYGAPAKGNTLLNYCGVRQDFLDYTVDRSPYKQGLFLPGTHIPILAPEVIRDTKPDYVLILPWNLKEEIMQQLEFIREWGGRFVLPIPKVMVI